MPNLGKLKTILSLDVYKDDAELSINTQKDANGVDVPAGIHFENKGGDFKNDYRFMNQSIIEEKLKAPVFKGAKFHVELEPSVASVQRFNFQATANSEHPTFVVKTDGDKLKFIFGDQSTHAGEFVFADGIQGKLTKSWAWPVAQVLSILKIADVNNTKMSFSDDGLLQITLDSGLATYNYIIPAQA